MVKLVSRPVVYGVAAVAGAGKMVGIKICGGQAVTVGAGSFCLQVTAVTVTGKTIQVGMAAAKGERVVVHRQPQKGYQLPGELHGQQGHCFGHTAGLAQAFQLEV